MSHLVHIENHNGFDIYFNRLNGFWETTLGSTKATKCSYESVKTSINDFVKTNKDANFTPYQIEKFNTTEGLEIATVVGITKNKLYIVEDSDGKRWKYSYEMKYWSMRNPNNDVIYNQIMQLQQEFNKVEQEHENKIDELENQLTLLPSTN